MNLDTTLFDFLFEITTYRKTDGGTWRGSTIYDLGNGVKLEFVTKARKRQQRQSGSYVGEPRRYIDTWCTGTSKRHDPNYRVRVATHDGERGTQGQIQAAHNAAMFDFPYFIEKAKAFYLGNGGAHA